MSRWQGFSWILFQSACVRGRYVVAAILLQTLCGRYLLAVTKKSNKPCGRQLIAATSPQPSRARLTEAPKQMLCGNHLLTLADLLAPFLWLLFCDRDIVTDTVCAGIFRQPPFGSYLVALVDVHHAADAVWQTPCDRYLAANLVWQIPCGSNLVTCGMWKLKCDSHWAQPITHTLW